MKPRSEYDRRARSFIVKDIEPGRYLIEVSASGLVSERRRVSVGKEGGKEAFILGREGMPAHFRGRVRVPFEPPKDLIAISVVRDFDERQEKDLEALAEQLGLQPEPVSEPIRDDLVRVFRLDAARSETERREIFTRLLEHPAVRRAGPWSASTPAAPAF